MSTMRCMHWDRSTGKRCAWDIELELCRFCGLQSCPQHRESLMVRRGVRIQEDGSKAEHDPGRLLDPFLHVCLICFARWFEKYF